MFDSYSFLSAEELRKQRQIYRFITRRWIYEMGKWYVQKLHLPVPAIYPVTLIFRHFIGGKNIDEVIVTIQKFKPKNIKVIIDYAVEGADDEKIFNQNLQVFLNTMDKISVQKDQIPFLAIKPTALASEKWLRIFSEENITTAGLEIYKAVKNRFFALFDKAYKAGVIILVDAEKSYTQNFIDKMVWEGMLQYNKDYPFVWNTVQLYRKDRLDFMTEEIRAAYLKGIYVGYKLVRGAYHEQEILEAQKEGRESPVFDKKEDTDKQYDDAIDLSLKNLSRVFFMCATHNKESILHAMQQMKAMNLKNNDEHVWFSQLYGMGDYLTYPLAEAGYNVAKYVPFAPISQALPYMIRRMEENSNAMGMAKYELQLIEKEWKKLKK